MARKVRWKILVTFKASVIQTSNAPAGSELFAACLSLGSSKPNTTVEQPKLELIEACTLHHDLPSHIRI